MTEIEMLCARYGWNIEQAKKLQTLAQDIAAAYRSYDVDALARLLSEQVEMATRTPLCEPTDGSADWPQGDAKQ